MRPEFQAAGAPLPEPLAVSGPGPSAGLRWTQVAGHRLAVGLLVKRSGPGTYPGCPLAQVALMDLCASDGYKPTLPRRNRTHVAISKKPRTNAPVPSSPPSTP